MGISLEVFWQTLPVMGWGMAGIFIVMAVIALVISLLNKVAK